ncbi:hypothetical protein ACFL1A_00430 [Patescibacteria group bacterium]
MKTIVTHIGPDLDAISSIWMVKKYFPGWEEASIAFVPAGTTLKGCEVDTDKDILHVDTGFGKYDHHQTSECICAAILIYEEVVKQKGPDRALERLVSVVNDIDHFKEVFFPDATSDFWDISLVSAIDGWRLLHSDNPIQVVSLGMEALDGIYKTFQNKVWAERELKNKGVEFSSKWGKAIALETVNDETVHLGQKMGYCMVIRKDPKKGYLRIKALPKKSINLKKYYEKLMKLDPDATWFLHASCHMILNGSSKNPKMKPSTLSIQEIIEVFKK